MNDLKVWKIICEIRYPAAAALFDNRGRIASNWQWTSDLTEWKMSNNQVSVHNKSNSKFLNVGFKNITVTMEVPENHTEFDDLASKFSVEVLKLLQVKKIERIGLRYIQLARRQHFKLLVSKMREKLFLLSNDDWTVFGGNPEDIGFPLTLAFDDKKANFLMGPMKSDQLISFFESAEVKKKLPSVALFLDFDLYKNDPDFNFEKYHEEISGFIKSGSEKIISTSNNIVEKFGGFK